MEAGAKTLLKDHSICGREDAQKKEEKEKRERPRNMWAGESAKKEEKRQIRTKKRERSLNLWAGESAEKEEKKRKTTQFVGRRICIKRRKKSKK